MSEALAELARQFADYARRWPAEAATVAHFHVLLAEGVEAFRREHRYGHFTGSAWLVSADGERVLLTHHRKLGLWLQLGGHADGDPDLPQVALREAQEESGIVGLHGEAGVFDLDRHRIPARGSDPEHWHYDVRYVVRTHGDERYTVGPESHALAWRRIDELALDAAVDASLRRMAEKWRTHLDSPNESTPAQRQTPNAQRRMW